MVDRIKRFSKDFGSLEFLLEDDGLVEEFIYSDPIEDKRLFIKADKGENNEVETDNQRNYEILATPNFWRAFFKFEKIWNKGEYKESLEIKWKEEEKKLETIDKQNEQNIKGKSIISIEIGENNQNKLDEIKEDFLKKYVNLEMKADDWDWKTKNDADASLFAVLIQNFDTAKSLDIDNIFLFRAYKETFLSYVKHVKTKLGLNVEDDKKDKQRHLPLNYEPYNFEDFQNIFEQTNIEIILNELKKYKFTWDKEENLLLFAKIGMKIKENSILNVDEENIDYFKGTFLETISYICSECREGFEIDGPQIPIELIKKTRKLVYDTIIEFNEEKIAGRVSDEIKEAYEQTFPQKREEEIED
uniref:Uncharacterized protein n=1 Tax=Meloidogyne javanica TaxID=6303 RepID=A0A915MYX6_MELJA